MPAPLLIIGIGNEARGDDALGILLLRRLAALELPGCECLETYQLQIEHALDLADRRHVLFLDAGHHTPPPYSHYSIQPQPGTTPYSHALAPEALLAVCQRLGATPPAASVLCIRGESFELGDGLSAQGFERLVLAEEFVRGWVVTGS